MDIRNSIILNDMMSPVLNNVLTSLRRTLELLRSTSGESQLFKQAEKDIMDAKTMLDEYNKSLKTTRDSLDLPSPGVMSRRTPEQSPIFSNYRAAMLPLTEIYSGIQLASMAWNQFKQITDLGDTFTLTTARINLMNDGLMTTKQIQDEIYASAQRSRAEYNATASAVTRMGILAGSAFKNAQGNLNTQELIKFTELVNKSFVIGGSTAIEQKSAMYQLTQAMASGRLQGDEMRTIREAAPMLRNAIRDYLKVDETTFKKMQKDGEITAEVIKNAVFSAQKDIDSAFEKMPITAAQAMTMVGNTITVTTQGISQGVSNMTVEVLKAIMENIDILAVVLGYLSSVTLVILAQRLYTAFATSLPLVYAHVTAFLLMHATTLMVVGVIFMVIGLLLKFPAIMGNIVGGVYAFGTAFLNVIKMIGDYFILLINNVIIKGINKILDALGKTKISELEYMQLSSVDANFRKGYTNGINFVNDLNKNIDKYRNIYSSTFNNPIKDKIPGLGPTLGSSIPEVNVNNVKGGKISLDDDSIKWLNEEGAVEFVNRYTTLRPVLRVSFGDVHETADVNQIIDKIVDLTQEAYNTELESGGDEDG